MEKGTKTVNYNLLKPDGDDFYNIADFNANADIIDGALKSLADKGVSIENSINSLATVSKTGSYNDLKDKPTKLSQFTNDSEYAVSSSLATVSKTGSYNDLKDKPTTISNADTVDGKHASEFTKYKGIVSDLAKVHETCFCTYNGDTLNTPLKAGLTQSGAGLCIINHEAGNTYETITVYPCGDNRVFTNTCSNEVMGSWKISDEANKVNGITFHPHDTSGTNDNSQPWVYAFNGGDDCNCYVKNMANMKAGDSNRLEGKCVDDFRGNSNFIYNSKNGGDLNEIKTEYNGFVFNMTNKPNECSYGFLEVSYFDGYGFTPASKGIIRQIWTDWQNPQIYVRLFLSHKDKWTDWNKIGGNADTLEGYTYDDITSEAWDNSYYLANKCRTEIVIRSYDTSSDVKGYSYADYTCTSTNARTVIQNAINNAGKGSVIRLLPGTYKITGGAITINKDVTIVGSGNSTSVIQSDDNNVFKISAGNTTLKDFMFSTSSSNTAKSLLYGNDNNELKDAIFDNIFFIINNSRDNAIANSVIKYCRFKSCRIYCSNSSDYAAIGFKNGSRTSIIDDMFNTGGGYFNIYIESSSDASSIKYSNNHRSRIKIANGSYTII